MIDVEEGVKHGGKVIPLKATQLGQFCRPPFDLPTTCYDLSSPSGCSEDSAGEEVRVQDWREARILHAQQREQVQVLVHKK